MTEKESTHDEKLCSYCGSNSFAANVMVSSSKNVATGLMYRKIRILADFEALLADVCQECGTVNRFHVQTRDRDWLQK